MKAKEFFLQVRHAEKELMILRKLISHYQNLGSAFSNGGNDGPVVSHSLGPSRVETAAIGIYDTTHKLEEETKQYVALIEKARRVIKAIPQEKYQHILELRYLADCSFKEISDSLKYKDSKSVIRAHGYALIKAQEILDKIV